MATRILAINNLTVVYRQGKESHEAVRDFSLEIAPGQTYGLVGESGSGKTTIALAVMGYLGANGFVKSGEIVFNDRDLLQLQPEEMRQVWGKQINLVPQDPLSSLNPSIQIGEQISEILREHSALNRQEARKRSIELLDMVKVPDPERVAKSYPHQISGGMQQRVLIAMALSTEPQLLVLDEPTTGLDVTTQAAVLELFADLVRERQTAALYVTHNLGVVARVCDRVAVLYAGELVEDGPVLDLFKQPFHPYTAGLLQSVPQIGQSKAHVELQAIPGQIPSIEARPTGCVFAPRCLVAVEKCRQSRPPLEMANDDRTVRCFRWQEIATREIAVINEKLTDQKRVQRKHANDTTLSIEDLRVFFPVRRSLSEIVRRQPAPVVPAVDGIDLKIEHGQILGIVGESGSGKTTLARAIAGLTERTGGEITLVGLNLPPLLKDRSLDTLRRLQYVFQNPEEALNPYMSVGETLKRPFITLLNKSDAEAEAEVGKLLEAVRLPPDYAERRPRQLSGGEKQRIAIARAFATIPELLITDEPVSALDVSVQASILNLLRDLQTEQMTTMIFISHDLAVVGYLADVVAVMYLGHVMELAPAAALFTPPHHPYTEALLSAIPVMDPSAAQEPILLEGDVSSQSHMPSGCPFHPRCPRKLGDICAQEPPNWQIAPDGGKIYCHISIEDLLKDQSAMAADL